MPPLPPDTVLIKRKRTAEPVDSLRVQESAGKRQLRRADFVYQRQPTYEDAKEPSLNHPAIKQTRQSLLPVSLLSKLAKNSAFDREQDAHHSGTHTPGDVSPPLPTGAATPIPPQIARPPPRFHISRSSAASSALNPNFLNPKRRNEFLFSERKVRPRNPDERNPQIAITQPQSPPQTRPQKKPGLAKYSRSSSPSTKPKQDIPLPLRNVSGMPWDVNSEELVAQMQAYTLQEIGKNIAASEAERPISNASGSTRLQSTGPSKFKPKKPALRYAQRHPEEIAAGAMDVDLGDEEYVEEEDTEDDSDYIIDTYVRVPVEALESVEEHTSFGFLVLDSQVDIDAFYREETDSDDEAEDEDEDENAENHYSADYPDEEVASDDEFGRNEYHYSKDIDEFDDYAFSDDENEDTKYPWLKVKKPNKVGDEDDEDEYE